MSISCCVANPYGIVFNCVDNDKPCLYIKNNIIMGLALSNKHTCARDIYEQEVRQNVDCAWKIARQKYKRSVLGAFQYFATILLKKKGNIKDMQMLADMGLPEYIFAIFYEKKHSYIYCINFKNGIVESSPFGRVYYGRNAKKYSDYISNLDLGNVSFDSLIELSSGITELSSLKEGNEVATVSTYAIPYQEGVQKILIKNHTLELIREKVHQQKKSIMNREEVEEEIEELRRERIKEIIKELEKQQEKCKVIQKER